MLKEVMFLKSFTDLAGGVAMTPGAMELALILSLAHSQAKLLASWLIAPLVAP